MRAKLKDNRTVLQHTGGLDEKGKVTKAKKKISYLFHSVDLKNAQESSMTEELIGFISCYLPFSLSPLFLSPSLTPGHAHIFHFPYWRHLPLVRHVPSQLSYIYVSLSPFHSLYFPSQSILPSLTPHTNTHTYFHHTRKLETLPCDRCPRAFQSVLSFTLHS